MRTKGLCNQLAFQTDSAEVPNDPLSLQWAEILNPLSLQWVEILAS